MVWESQKLIHILVVEKLDAGSLILWSHQHAQGRSNVGSDVVNPTVADAHCPATGLPMKVRISRLFPTQQSNLAQWKRAGLITRRSHDRNVQLLALHHLEWILFGHFWWFYRRFITLLVDLLLEQWE
ncbi:hypothetical protein BGZ61DRAFT_512130 [Ilyonectria robusta]|uniref:uncharacterized protein n=1 Tax=Ilyonectria robusta TaxID=1079257 RepID=UPI001E8EBCDA|nr:uncharacterized protein BGZ61DRAFT_512130 [Ilyonectria robusta]KAH8737568.1 hypothetical protein BGZ61DRAFT_512130 [Ilyonectria robusta]